MKLTRIICQAVGLKVATSASAVCLVIAGIGLINAQSPGADNHVTICHRTGSASNPYVVTTLDVEGILAGHIEHEQTGNGPGGDIIPPFTFNGVTYSKNMDTVFANGTTGATIADNGCNILSEPTPTPTVPQPPAPPAPVPEPMTIILFGTGLASIGMAANRRFRRKGSGDDVRSIE